MSVNRSQRLFRRMTLSPRQTVAFASPCYRAEDTAQPRFGWIGGGNVGTSPGRRLSFVLTVNVGLE